MESIGSHLQTTAQNFDQITILHKIMFSRQTGSENVTCGPHELGLKITHGDGLKTLAKAQKEWERVHEEVFKKHHPELTMSAGAPKVGNISATSRTTVKDFIPEVWEPERTPSMESNSRINWERYRDSFYCRFSAGTRWKR